MSPERKNRWLILLLAGFLFLPWLGDKKFYTRGEAREGLVIQSIADDGRWVAPEGYGGIIASKPPLMHWIGAMTSKVVGEVTEFSSRFPSAIASVLFLQGWFFFALSRVGFRKAMLSAFILMTSLEWFRLSGTARVDLVHGACLAASLLSFYVWYIEKKSIGAFLMVLFLVGATLSKGPVGLLLPAGSIAVFLFLRREVNFSSLLRISMVFIAALAVSLSWYFIAYRAEGERFLQIVFLENFQRFTGTIPDDPHKASVFYLWGSLLVGFVPWSLFVLPEWIATQCVPSLKRYAGEQAILAAGETFFQRVVRVMRDGKNTINRSFVDLQVASTPLHQLMVVSCIVVVAFYSIPSGKRSVYLIAIYPFLSLFLANYLLHLDAKRHRFFAGAVVTFAVCLMSLLVVAFGAAMIAPLFSNHPQFQFYGDMVQRGFNGMSLLQSLFLAGPLLVGGWVVVKWSQTYRRSLVAYAFYFSYAVLLAVQAVLAPLYANAISSEGFAKSVMRNLPGDATLSSFQYEFYGVSFYSHKRFSTKRTGFQAGEFVLLFERDLPKLSEALGASLQWETVVRSQRSVDKPLEFAVMVKVIPAIAA